MQGTIEGYSKIAKPLNQLMAGYHPAKKRGKVYKWTSVEGHPNPKVLIGDEWTPECDTAFQTLIQRLTSTPVLAFANPQLPYVLHTDACRQRLGAALYQDCLSGQSVKSSMFGCDFTVFTDNNPLTYILTSAKLDAAGHRWLAALFTYHFSVKYRPG